MVKAARAAVNDVLPRKMTAELWKGGYTKVLPITVQDFDLSAALPAIFYMLRFGQRRGRGRFLETFSPASPESKPQERRRSTTIDRVADVLGRREDLIGFDDGIKRAILGDLLLCFGLENVRRELGRDKQIQRVAPTHYMTSWIDLPDSVAHLRGIPEMIVATLANQDRGDHVDARPTGRFPIAGNYEENPLLDAFSRGVRREGPSADRAGDRFEESNQDVGLDQLLMIRLAQQMRSAPARAKGKDSEKIPNQRPIAIRASRDFSEDIRRFVRSYASEVPRLALVDMLEVCIATGVTTILMSVVEILFRWLERGEVSQPADQGPAQIFVDCSTGVDRDLRMLAEQSFDDVLRRSERVPTVLTILRVLDYAARDNKKIKHVGIRQSPYATDWLNLLGDLLHERHSEAAFIHRKLDEDCERLADALVSDYPDVAETFRNVDSESNAVRRFAMGMTELMGSKARLHLMGMIDSTMLMDRPNGLAKKRSTTRGSAASGIARRRRDVRSLIFSDAVLDYLVHLHLLPSGNKPGVRRLSVSDFLDTLRRRYGFCVDVAPIGSSVSNELLRLNRRTLERRLRDLGLLVGVNDAESMKRLRPRFQPREDK